MAAEDKEWESNRGSSSLSWQQAQPASRAAWERIDSSHDQIKMLRDQFRASA